MPSRDHLPLVYSCSGCSSAAQMANHLAISLDRRGMAEMSCIAGVGGDVPKLVRLAKSGRGIIGIDPVTKTAQRPVCSDHQTNAGAESIKGGISLGALHDCFDLNTVLIMIARRR
jgi:uncharacterized metal-binding protein